MDSSYKFKKEIPRTPSLNLQKQQLKSLKETSKQVETTDIKPSKIAELRDKFASQPKVHTGERVNKEIGRREENIDKIVEKRENLDYFPSSKLRAHFVEVAQFLVNDFNAHSQKAIEDYGKVFSGKSYDRNTSKDRLEFINNELKYMKEALDGWHSIYRSARDNEHIELFRDSSNDLNITIEEEYKKAEEALGKVLESYKKREAESSQEREFQQIVDWFQRPRRWEKEVSAIVSVLEKSDARTRQMALRETDSQERQTYLEKSIQEEEDDYRQGGGSLMYQRDKYRDISRGKEGKPGAIETAKEIQKLVPKKPYEKLGTLRETSHQLLDMEMKMLQKANVKETGEQSNQWKEMKALLDKLQEQGKAGKVSPDDIVECRTKYIKGYSECLNSLYKAHQAEKSENSEETSEGEKVKSAREKNMERIRAKNCTQEVYLQLEMVDLKIKDLPAFHQMKEGEDAWEKPGKSLYNQFDNAAADLKTLATCVNEMTITRTVDREGYLDEIRRIVSRWEDSYHPAHSNFLNHMRKAVRADKNKIQVFHLDMAKNEMEQTSPQLQALLSEIEKLTEKFYQQYPLMRNYFEQHPEQRRTNTNQ